jgi:phage/plasmid-associated DNA primase
LLEKLSSWAVETAKLEAGVRPWSAGETDPSAGRTEACANSMKSRQVNESSTRSSDMKKIQAQDRKAQAGNTTNGQRDLSSEELKSIKKIDALADV